MPQPDETIEARNRILAAAREEVRHGGWAAATSGRVAQRAGVSKALIHYHFRDKAALLVALATQCQESVRARGDASEQGESADNPVDRFNDWLQRELAAGDVGLAIGLLASRNAAVRRAAHHVLGVFRDELERRTARVFTDLALTPTIPQPLVVDQLATAAHGMAVVPIGSPTRQRQLLETLWLSVLTMSE